MTTRKLRLIKVIKILLLTVYFPALAVYLGVFVPEHLACAGINEDGAIGINIWGGEVQCFGESGDLGRGLFQFFSLVISGFTLIMIIYLIFYYKLKRHISIVHK